MVLTSRGTASLRPTLPTAHDTVISARVVPLTPAAAESLTKQTLSRSFLKTMCWLCERERCVRVSGQEVAGTSLLLGRGLMPNPGKGSPGSRTTAWKQHVGVNAAPAACKRSEYGVSSRNLSFQPDALKVSTCSAGFRTSRVVWDTPSQRCSGQAGGGALRH